VGGLRKAQTATEEKTREFIIKEGIDMRLNIVKRTVMATALAVVTAVAGVAGQAQAFSFSDNELVLAIYGSGSSDALFNLGNANTVKQNGFTADAALQARILAGIGAVGGSVKYTIIGVHDLGAGTQAVWGGTPSLLSSINQAQLGLTGQSEAMFGWLGQGTAFIGDTIGKTDGRAFTANLNSDGSNTLLGSWPVFMGGGLEQQLNLVKGVISPTGAQTLSQMGIATLTSGGAFSVGSVAAVPLPGVVVLFGTGLIGLVGIARRSFKKMAA
jgi:hypothetical protein